MLWLEKDITACDFVFCLGASSRFRLGFNTYIQHVAWLLPRLFVCTRLARSLAPALGGAILLSGDRLEDPVLCVDVAHHAPIQLAEYVFVSLVSIPTSD